MRLKSAVIFALAALAGPAFAQEAAEAAPAEAPKENPELEAEMAYVEALVNNGYPDIAAPVIEATKKRWPEAEARFFAIEVRSLLSLGKFEEAEKKIAALPDRKSTKYWAARLEIANNYFYRGQKAESMKIYDDFFKSFPNPPPDIRQFYMQACYTYGQLLIGDKQYAKAAQRYEVLFKQLPVGDNAWCNVACETVDLYLRIANELYLKRLIVGGFAGVYEFSRNFRNEGMDRTHNPEFTAMEIYVPYKDYNWMMTFTENMLERIALALHNDTKVNVWGNDIDFKPPFRRAPMCALIKEETGVDVSGMSEEQLREACKQLGVETDATMGKGKLIDAIFGEKCEGKLIQPTFVTDYPIEMSPLCKRHRDNPELTERFELFVCGKELANAYSELNDPIDQLGRFQEQLRLSEKGDDEAMFIDMDFVRALEYGMPPTSGMGIGIDRLVMMMTGAQSIQDVLLFPQMKPEVHANSGEDEGADLVAHGVDEAWIAVLAKAGVKSYEQMKAANPNKLFNDLGGLRKKMKLDIPALKREQFDAWLKED